MLSSWTKHQMKGITVITDLPPPWTKCQREIVQAYCPHGKRLRKKCYDHYRSVTSVGKTLEGRHNDCYKQFFLLDDYKS